MDLAETTYSESIKVDRDAGIIRDVKVLGRISKNGREYSDKALDDAARIYEGVKVRFDHPPKNEPGKERQFIDSFGRLERLRRAADGVYADLPFKKSHPLADLVCESAERFSKDFGLSHNSEGTCVTRDGKTIVESITKARGVDVVDSPASTQGIFESSDKSDASVTIQLNETLTEDRDTEADTKLMDAVAQIINGAVKDGSIDTPETIRKIRKMLRAHDTIHDMNEPGSMDKPAEAAPAMKESQEKPKQEEKQMAESTETKPADTKPEPKPEMPSAGPDGQLTEAQFRFFMESVVAENNELKAALAKQTTERQAMEREVKARRLLESKGREANPFTEQGRRNVETLLKVDSESLWTTLIDSWPQKNERPRPLRTGSVMESHAAGRRYHSPLDVHDGKSLVAAIFE